MVDSQFIEDPLLFIGLIFVIGFASSIILDKYKVPHVVVYLLTGFAFANTLYRDIDLVVRLENWYIVSETLALGLIGFKIGTELKFKQLLKEPKFIVFLLVAEAGAALILVTFLVYLYTGSFLMSIIMGGLATATTYLGAVSIQEDT